MKYDKIEDGKWYAPIRKGYKLMCCDCGLVHRFDFRTVPLGGGREIQLRVYRDKRATAASRRTGRHAVGCIP